jgi:hypothetical protein
MYVKERFPLSCMDLEFNGPHAPDILCISHIYLLPELHFLPREVNLVFVLPLLVEFLPMLPSLKLILLSLFSSALLA